MPGFFFTRIKIGPACLFLVLKATKMPKLRLLFLAFLCPVFSLLAQEDSTSNQEDDFDFSDFELAAPPTKVFCNNKVLGQSPTALIGAYYTYQAAHDFTAGNLVEGLGQDIADEGRIDGAHELYFTGNFPLVSRNDILINLTPMYREQRYQMRGFEGHPLSRSLEENALRRAVMRLTVFKPLNENTFLLGRAGVEYNGDYRFSDLQSANSLLYTASLLYGWKPHDRLMYAFGLSRTYLGGALNYVPIAYYYHTFRNEKWGIEALLPARGALRYRFNSLSLASLGFRVVGGSYFLNQWSAFADDYGPGANEPELAAAQNVELRRSEILAGLTYQRQLTGFIWLTAEAGYRINYSYELDNDGDFLRFFGNDRPYYIENDLANTLYFNIGISYTSP